MTYETVIRVAPETSAARLSDESRNGRTLYDTSQMRFVPGKTSVPLLANHDPAREIGRVTKLIRLRDIDGWWLCAVAEVESPPSWVRRGTRASFGYRQLQGDSFGMNIVRAGVVDEVSVLTDDVEPYEPGAMVLWCKPKVAEREQVIHGGAMIRRLTGRVTAVEGVPL